MRMPTRVPAGAGRVTRTPVRRGSMQPLHLFLGLAELRRRPLGLRPQLLRALARALGLARHAVGLGLGLARLASGGAGGGAKLLHTLPRPLQLVRARARDRLHRRERAEADARQLLLEAPARELLP